MKWRYISSISQTEIRDFEEILFDKRLLKSLWIEFIFNPEAVRIAEKFIHNPKVKEALTDALSWYLAFKWIIPENSALIEFYNRNKKDISPYRVKFDVYKEKRRAFLKGLIHEGLC